MSLPVRTGAETVPFSPRSAVAGRTSARPTPAQRRYLERGLGQPGGKLPLFDRDGQEIDRKTVESCLVHGWAERWFHNPLKPGWHVCKLTEAGYAVLGETPNVVTV